MDAPCIIFWLKRRNYLLKDVSRRHIVNEVLFILPTKFWLIAKLLRFARAMRAAAAGLILLSRCDETCDETWDRTVDRQGFSYVGSATWCPWNGHFGLWSPQAVIIGRFFKILLDFAPSSQRQSEYFIIFAKKISDGSIISQDSSNVHDFL